MEITVEPQNGSELDRLITALLNATGVVHQLVAHEPDIGAVAKRLRAPLALAAELYDDAELGVLTHLLAWSTMLVAAELGPRAEREGFEPSRQVNPAHAISNRAP